MTTELTILAAVGGLALALTLIQGTRNVLVLGLPTAAGNQHDIPPWEGGNDRLNRAVRNLVEALIIFAPITLAVHLLGVGNETSVLGAKVFLVARLVHAIVYTLGIPYLRTTAWFAGVIGILLVASALLA